MFKEIKDGKLIMDQEKLKHNIMTAISLILMILTCILMFYFIPLYIGNHQSSFDDAIPDYDNTTEWKRICAIENPCKWYQIGCQKYCCVMDCSEINKFANETICVC